MLSVAINAMVVSGCVTVVQPPYSPANTDLQLTDRQKCANFVRANTDRFKNTREMTLGSAAGAGIAEATRKENESATVPSFAIVSVFTIIGYLID